MKVNATAGKFATLEAVEAKCRSIVESFFADNKQTYISYTMYGEDPFVKSLDPTVPASTFSAWNHAKTIAKK